MRETRSSGSVEGVMSNRDPYSDCRTIPIKNFFVFDKWRTQREVSVFLTALATARCHLARRMALLLWNLHLNDVQVTCIGINSHNHRHVLVFVILQRVGVVHLVLLAVRVIGKGLAVGVDFA